MPRLTFVLGGRRSGKSTFASARARELGGDQVTYVATAHRGDPELEARIAEHLRHRPPAWSTLEAGSDLASAIASAAAEHVVLVDSLTLWAAPLVEDEVDLLPAWEAALAAVRTRIPPVVLVSDEVGSGMVPLTALGRRFSDELGTVHQAAAAAADEFYLMVAGVPLRVK